MARCRTQRAFACASLLVAMAVAGCGASAAHLRPGLHSAGERRLLGLVDQARADVSRHNGAAAHATLLRFVAAVRRLRASGQLSAGTATRLQRQALAAGEQAVLRLQISTTTQASTTTAVVSATTTAAPPPPAVAPGHGHGHGGGNPHPGGPPGQQAGGPPGQRQGHQDKQGQPGQGQGDGGDQPSNQGGQGD